jgi:basic amino acid/polyamine antiporter, APA family
MDNPASPTSGRVQLRRALTFWPLLFYGLGVIVGAGIYVAIGAVIRRAGDAAPLSFLLAGIAAGLTGLCYAELAGRFPEAGGGVSYVRHGFGSDRLAKLVGLATTAAIVIAAASIAHGTVQYLRILLPLPPLVLVCLLVACFTLVAILGIRESVGLAAAMGIIELFGLLVAAAVGLANAPDLHLPGLIPASLPAWSGALNGAFTAFFAFIGFETLANLAEEVRDPPRTLPRGILAAVAISVALYVLVAFAAVLGGDGSDTPLLALFSGRGAAAFAVIGTIAVANGVLVHIVMLARLFYGMAVHGQLPGFLAHVQARTQTPVAATMLASGLVLITAVALPFERLLMLVNLLTLSVFAIVDLALWRIHRRAAPTTAQFRAPAWVPPVAALVSLALIMADLLG